MRRFCCKPTTPEFFCLPRPALRYSGTERFSPLKSMRKAVPIPTKVLFLKACRSLWPPRQPVSVTIIGMRAAGYTKKRAAKAALFVPGASRSELAADNPADHRPHRRRGAAVRTVADLASDDRSDDRAGG